MEALAKLLRPVPLIRMTSVICLAQAMTGCGDNGPVDPGTGSVEVTTISTGEAVDADGYVVEVQGAASLAIGANATATLPAVTAGDLLVRLTGVRGNCKVQGAHPRLLRVVAGETFRTHFDIACVHSLLLGRIVFSSNRDGNYEIYSMHPDGSDQVRLTNTPDERELSPSSSPDGNKILYTHRQGPSDFYESKVYVMNADGTNRVNLSRADSFDEYPAWSPDGSRIAFANSGDSGYDIWVMNADGTAPENLTNTSTAFEGLPVWSPDGARILFPTFSEADTTHLDVMNSDGSGRTRLYTDNPANPWAPSWSPDGLRIAFLSFGNEVQKLFTMNLDGSERIRLTGDGNSTDGIGSWSPAGDRIAFDNDATGDRDVYVINVDGTGAVDLSNNPADDALGAQAWGP